MLIVIVYSLEGNYHRWYATETM